MIVSVIGYVIIAPQGPAIWVALDSKRLLLSRLSKDGWAPEHEGLVRVNGGSLPPLPRPLPEAAKGAPSLDHVMLQVNQDVE